MLLLYYLDISSNTRLALTHSGVLEKYAGVTFLARKVDPHLRSKVLNEILEKYLKHTSSEPKRS